jgi:hypothetical protein
MIASNFKFCSFESGGGVDGKLPGAVAFVANRSVKGAWETLQIIKNPNDSISFRMGNYYLTAENGGGGVLSTLATAIGDWEQFWPLGDRLMCFDKLHCLEMGSDLVVRATASYLPTRQEFCF